MKNLILLYILAFLAITSSCVTQKKIEYVQNKGHQPKEFTNSPTFEYRLKPKDEVYIQISSLDEAASTISNNSNRSEVGALTPYGASLMSQTIDKEGYLELPVIGKLQVKDKTLAEVTSLIKGALMNVLNQPIVSVKLVNTFISVLGEVKNPGHYVYSEHRLSIFDGIGLAGDVTEYGNRGKVILIRNENGSNVRRELNLLKSEVLASEYYYLRPGDIIYIKPMRSKFWGFKEFPFGTILSAITTAILVLNYAKYTK